MRSPSAGFARITAFSALKTITPSAMELRIAWLRPASIRSRVSAWASALVLSATILSRFVLIIRRSCSACSRLLDDIQAIKATRKYPSIAGEFGILPVDSENIAMIPLASRAKKKAAPGRKIRLAIAMGITKTNSERPAESCSGVSLKEIAAINSNRNKLAEKTPDQ